MEQNNRGNLLRVEKKRENVFVEVKGTGEEILTNWAIATHVVCEKLHMSPFALATMLPEAVANVQNGIDGRVSIDMDAIRKAKECGNDRGRENERD